MGCKRIRFQRHPTRSFESETLRGTRSWLGGGVRPSASERAQRPTESSRPVALNALPQTERRANKYAGNGVPCACCASSGSEDHALPGLMDDSPRSDASEMRSPPASRERATREAETCALRTAKPEDDCRTPKGPFPAVVRISSGRFTCPHSHSWPADPSPHVKTRGAQLSCEQPGTKRRGPRVTPAAALEPGRRGVTGEGIEIL